MSFVAIWKFRILPGKEPDFLGAYGPDGRWVALFRRGEGFLSSELLRDLEDPSVFITIDRWRSQEAYRAFRSSHAAEYEALDRECEALTSGESRVTESEVC